MVNQPTVLQSDAAKAGGCVGCLRPSVQSVYEIKANHISVRFCELCQRAIEQQVRAIRKSNYEKNA